MRNLAQYVLQGRRQAIWVALLFSFLPFLGWVANAIMALVTLRKGPKEGVFVLLWVLLPSIVIASLGFPQIWFYDILGSFIATYVLACVLREVGSWSGLLQIAMILGVIAVLGVHLIAPNLGPEWANKLAQAFQQMHKQGTLLLNTQNVANIVGLMAKIGIGLQVAFLLLANLFSILIARWAQAILYNPGGLGPELLNIRLGKFSIAVLVLVILGSITGVDAAIDCLPVVLLPYMIAGISLVHSFLGTVRYSTFWLVMFYGSLFVLFPYFVGILTVLALFDSWLDMRRYFAKTA